MQETEFAERGNRWYSFYNWAYGLETAARLRNEERESKWNLEILQVQEINLGLENPRHTKFVGNYAGKEKVTERQSEG